MTAAATWGVPHAPGYPLFTAIGRAFVALPLGSVPYRVHLTSAVFHAVAVGFVVDATRTLTRSTVAAVAAGTALGLGRAFFLGSLYAETFPLNDAFFAALLALSLRVACHSPPPRRTVIALALAVGLSAAHHPMIVLAIPTVLVLAGRSVLRTAAEAARYAGWITAAVLVPPIVAYALVPIAAARDPYLSWEDVHDLRSLLALALRADYGGPWSAAHRASAEGPLMRAAALGESLAGGMGVATLVVACAGIAALWRDRRRAGVALLLAVLLPGPIFACANAVDVGSEAARAFFERFTTMPAVAIALAFGAGVARIAAVARGRWAATAAGGLGLLVWTFERAAAARPVDLHDDRRGIAFAHDLVLPSPDRSLLLLTGDMAAGAAAYVCAVEQRCGKRIVLSPGMLFLPWKMAQVRRRWPELRIGWSAGPALRHTHELVEAEGGERPVLVMAALLAKDPELTGFPLYPDHLVFRVWPRGSRPDAESFRASAEALAAGRCEGCLPFSPPEPRPSQEVEIVETYAAAYAAHAAAARAADAPLAERLTALAAAAAARLDADPRQGGGASISR